MKNTRIIITTVLFFIFFNLHQYPSSRYKKVKFFHFKYGIKINRFHNEFKNFRIYLPLPATVNNQKLIFYKINKKKFKLYKSKKHNIKYLGFSLHKELNKKSISKILIEVKIKKIIRNYNFSKLIIKPYNKNLPFYKYYTRGNNFIQTYHSEIINKAYKLNSFGISKKIVKSFHMTRKTLKITARFKGLQKLSFIIKHKSGECSDFSTYFIALLRKLGIPARHVVGRIFTPSIKNSWHVWSEFYINPKGWIPCDTFYYKWKGKKLLGYEPINYIIFHKGINIPLPVTEKISSMPILQTYYYLYEPVNKKVKFKIKYIWQPL